MDFCASFYELDCDVDEGRRNMIFRVQHRMFSAHEWMSGCVDACKLNRQRSTTGQILDANGLAYRTRLPCRRRVNLDCGEACSTFRHLK